MATHEELRENLETNRKQLEELISKNDRYIKSDLLETKLELEKQLKDMFTIPDILGTSYDKFDTFQDLITELYTTGNKADKKLTAAITDINQKAE